MPEQRIDPVLVEKAAKAIYEAQRPKLERLNPHSYFQRWDELQSQSMRDQAIAEAGAVVSVVFDELGLKEERLDPDPRSMTQFAPQVRLVSDYRPVEQGDGR